MNGNIVYKNDLKLNNIIMVQTFEKYFLVYDEKGTINIYLK